MRDDRFLLTACVAAIATTSFGFISRAFLIMEWGRMFNLSETQIGALQGVGLYPFAISIILCSLIVDKLGYGRTMGFAWVAHVVSAIVTLTADGYAQLYLGTLIFALANGAVEAATNPIVASLYPRQKTHYLNILHAGWPGGLVLGGVLAIALGDLPWQWKIGLFLLPTLVYGAMMLRCRFPVQERVAAGVPYREMLGEFGWAGCLIVSFFIARAIDEVFRVFGTELGTGAIAALCIVPTAIYAATVRRFGRPMFAFLLLVMVLLATTELGTDSWVAALLTPVLREFGANAGNWVLIYTSAIMFVLRFFAGPIAHRLSPLGLLAAGSALAAVGLMLLSSAGAAAGAIFVAATLYGIGKAFFWPTTLGVVSEQFPRGGALTLNAMGGMGMIAVGVLGNPLLGTLQDNYLDKAVQRDSAAIHAAVAGPEQTKYGFTFRSLDKQRIAALPEQERAVIDRAVAHNTQATLKQVAVLPVIMCLCYLGLILYFRRRGGYAAVHLERGG
jgi:MFS family permease